MATDPPDFGFVIHVERVGSELGIGVDQELSGLRLPGLVLRSSRRREPRIEGTRWPEGVRWLVDHRLEADGARKGRVLAIWQGDQVIALSPWHLHTHGPVVIFDVARRIDLPEEQGITIASALLLCLRQIAAAPAIHRGPNLLRWTDLALDHHPDPMERDRLRGAVRRRSQQLGFGPLRPPRPQWLAGHWAVERRFRG